MRRYRPCGHRPPQRTSRAQVHHRGRAGATATPGRWMTGGGRQSPSLDSITPRRAKRLSLEKGDSYPFNGPHSFSKFEKKRKKEILTRLEERQQEQHPMQCLLSASPDRRPRRTATNTPKPASPAAAPSQGVRPAAAASARWLPQHLLQCLERMSCSQRRRRPQGVEVRHRQQRRG